MEPVHPRPFFPEKRYRIGRSILSRARDSMCSRTAVSTGFIAKLGVLFQPRHPYQAMYFVK
ncbi:hypothetical protein Plhal304r1_c097g0174111 [Plasmopara halstedii]